MGTHEAGIAARQGLRPSGRIVDGRLAADVAAVAAELERAADGLPLTGHDHVAADAADEGGDKEEEARHEGIAST